jgi:hypothetical protein
MDKSKNAAIPRVVPFEIFDSDDWSKEYGWDLGLFTEYFSRNLSFVNLEF